MRGALVHAQAPPRMKSLVMAFFLLSTSMGNAITMAVNAVILGSAHGDGASAEGASQAAYYAFFILLMLATATAFVPYARAFRQQTYVQGAPGAAADGGATTTTVGGLADAPGRGVEVEAEAL